MKSTLGLFSFVLLSLIIPSTALLAQTDLADLIEDAEKSVLRIEVNGIDGDGLGSGYVVSADGLFVTNVHVMAGAQKAVAVFNNGHRVNISGTYLIDENRDICVCQLEGRGYKPISFARAMPRKGETVIALGSPHGLSFSATTGIVSAIRPQEEAQAQMGRPRIEGTWIQVDAALSPGNSGGPLINKNGEVVGMSTLASGGGRAQNLNFGISIDDIRTAVDKAQDRRLTRFRDGIQNVAMEEGGGGGGGGGDGAIIKRSAIPEAALDKYVTAGREQYKDLSKTIRKDAATARSLLKDFKRGETYLPRNSTGDVMVGKGRTTDKYYFRNESVKTRVMTRQKTLSSRLNAVKDKIPTNMTNDSLVALLMNGGPRLDGRSPKSVGFMKDAIVAKAFNDHDVVVIYDDVPYLMWVETTAGLASGSTMTPTPVYVAGTETIEVPNRGTQSVTILNSVAEDEIHKAVYGSSHSPLDEFRTWTDSTGKFSFEAIFVEAGQTQVVLKDRAGKIKTVPLDKLSSKDLSLIKQFSK